jgi:hypothetical protein
VRILALLLVTVTLAACGDDEQEAGAPGTGTRLNVEVTKAASQPIRMQLVCDGCDLAKVRKAVAAPDAERACTLQYGGPEEAHVTGSVEGKPVDVTIDRADGCGIAAYDALFTAFGREPPVAR